MLSTYVFDFCGYNGDLFALSTHVFDFCGYSGEFFMLSTLVYDFCGDSREFFALSAHVLTSVGTVEFFSCSVPTLENRYRKASSVNFKLVMQVVKNRYFLREGRIKHFSWFSPA